MVDILKQACGLFEGMLQYIFAACSLVRFWGSCNSFPAVSNSKGFGPGVPERLRSQGVPCKSVSIRGTGCRQSTPGENCGLGETSETVTMHKSHVT